MCITILYFREKFTAVNPVISSQVTNKSDSISTPVSLKFNFSQVYLIQFLWIILFELNEIKKPQAEVTNQLETCDYSTTL